MITVCAREILWTFHGQVLTLASYLCRICYIISVYRASEGVIAALRLDQTLNQPSPGHGRSRRHRLCSDLNLCHVGVASAGAAAFFAHGKLGVLQELQAGGSRTPVLHLIDRLADEAQQIVDILSLHEIVLLLLEEEEVRVEDLD